MQLLAQRISQSINQVGLLIDPLYKLPEKQRQQFLNKIQTLKNNLVSLKSSLRNSNKQHIENQYKQSRLQIMQIKKNLEDILQHESSKKNIIDNHNNNKSNQQNTNNLNLTNFQQQNKLNSSINNKQRGIINNKNTNNSLFQSSMGKVGVMKHINKKQYQDLMINIVEKTQLNKQITLQVKRLEKQNEELKKQYCQISQKYREKAASQTSFQIQINQLKLTISNNQKVFRQKEKQISCLRSSNADLSSQIQQQNLEILQLRKEFQIVRQKLQNYENLSLINTRKNQILEKNMTEIQKQRIQQNRQYHNKQIQLDKRIKQLSQIHQKYNQQKYIRQQLEQKLINQSEDVFILQNELSRYQKQLYELKISKQAENTKYLQQKQHLQQTQKQISNLKSIIKDFQQQLYIQKSDNQYLKSQVIQLQQIIKLQKQQNQNIQTILMKQKKDLLQQRNQFVCQIELKNIQINKLSDQVRKSLLLIQSLQQEIQNTQRYKNQLNQNRDKLSGNVQILQAKNFQLIQSQQRINRMCNEMQINLEQKNKQLEIYKKKYIALQSQLKQTKIRLHKAKIQTIHDLRNTLF